MHKEVSIEIILVNLNVGREIFDSVPKKFQPGWGETLLLSFENFIQPFPQQITELYDIIADEKIWNKAHSQFSEIRNFLLKNENFQPQSFLLLAENIAKITYNNSGFPAPFDSNSGWFIPSLAIDTALYFKNEELTQEIMRILLLHYKA